MKQALGLVEISGLSTAVVVADTMAKAANIRILEIENTKGLGYMTIKAAGDVGAVTAAVNAGRQVGITNQKLVSWKIIPRPSDYVEQAFCSPNPPAPPDPPAQKQQEETDAETGADALAKDTGTEPKHPITPADETAGAMQPEEAVPEIPAEAGAETAQPKEAAAPEIPAEAPAQAAEPEEEAPEPPEEAPAQTEQPEEAAPEPETTVEPEISGESQGQKKSARRGSSARSSGTAKRKKNNGD